MISTRVLIFNTILYYYQSIPYYDVHIQDNISIAGVSPHELLILVLLRMIDSNYQILYSIILLQSIDLLILL